MANPSIYNIDYLYNVISIKAQDILPNLQYILVMYNIIYPDAFY